MNEKEKLEFKIEILNDIRSCIGFNFGSISYDSLNSDALNILIDKYKNILKGIDMDASSN